MDTENQYATNLDVDDDTTTTIIPSTSEDDGVFMNTPSIHAAQAVMVDSGASPELETLLVDDDVTDGAIAMETGVTMEYAKLESPRFLEQHHEQLTAVGVSEAGFSSVGDESVSVTTTEQTVTPAPRSEIKQPSLQHSQSTVGTRDVAVDDTECSSPNISLPKIEVKIIAKPSDVPIQSIGTQFPQINASFNESTHVTEYYRSLTNLSLRAKRRPAKFLNMSKVVLSARNATDKDAPSLFVDPPKSEDKNCILPAPWTYSVPDKPLTERNAPLYTIGQRLEDKHGGGRTSWEKLFYSSPHDMWTWKTRFDDACWPSPDQYYQDMSPGKRQFTKPNPPSFTLTGRPFIQFARRGAEKEPAPNEYRPQIANDTQFTIGPKSGFKGHRVRNLWPSQPEKTPGPGAYKPRLDNQRRHQPSFTMRQGRTAKDHYLGPFTVL